MSKIIHKNNSVLVVTLGCSKNVVDSEKLMKQLSANSLAVEFDEENSSARTVIINTCGFISDAKKESVDTILKYTNEKLKGRIDNLFVMGCLSQRYKDTLLKEIPEVDGFFGVNQFEQIVKALGYRYRHELIGERIISTPSHYAYLKISEGCNRKCSFCAIPQIRGAYHSFPLLDLLKEAELLAEQGVKELIIIAQDSSIYGKDLNNKFLLPKLIDELSKLNKIEWIRIHYAYPKDFPNELLNVIRDNPKVCKYLDLPIQHISDKMLKLMRRGLNKQKTIKLIDKIRGEIPGINLRTTLLIGHPGETNKDFMELMEYIEEARFERLGTFIYSHEDNTYSAFRYKDSIPLSVKKKREHDIMTLQKRISLEKNQRIIGETLKVIVDRREGMHYFGRTEYDSPEIDNEVLIETNNELDIGTFYQVKIVDANEYDLKGIY